MAYSVDDVGIGTEWLCDNHRVPGVQVEDESQLKVQCEGLVRQKLLSPTSADFQDDAKVETTSNCGRKWVSSVDAQNALGVKIRRTFTCTHDAEKNLVNLKIDPI